MNNDFSSALKKSGLRKTKHRTAVLGVLDGSARPVAAEDVYLSLKENGVSINLSTVYRVLDTLASSGLITKLSIAGEPRSLFEINTMEHRHYLVCVGCNKIECIEGCPLKAYEKTLEERTRYAIAGHRLDIYGYCPECREKGRGAK